MSYTRIKTKGFIKKETPIIVRKENREYLKSYLFEVKKRSDRSYINNRVALRRFFVFIDKPVNKINMIDLRNYFIDHLDIDEKLSLSSKEVHRSILHSFFSHIQAVSLGKGIIYQNPVPSKKVFKFTQFDKDIKKQSEKELKTLTKGEIFRILDFSYKNRRQKDFIMLGLAVCTGARISEIITINLNNINLSERYFETGFEKNARKSTLRTKESLLFFFPEKFRIYLENYILSLKSLNPNVEWLFPKPYKNEHITSKSPYYISKFLKQKLNIEFSYHYFRKTLISERMKSGCPEWLSEGLANHKGTTVERANYIKLNIQEKREYYDKYFPYYEFPYF